ncbi:isocitrate dehydrogenase [NAD] catalytic subunit 5, mitochondrial-like isoform X1 [Chenopodium quinoa]|uniref:isocitrate dehydrogenase [NAD] catalytic subunit 5, mitochondrial-like isoform X1 n=1 Tax=Chenopodium quinoa TaxID=63459 RepID=UPI000B791A51|nr:isocitrate dehydrogenase [NAD] catalytic subunit 5, mitochondrial-like isoform X1 [Chenopodium quinoa]
MAANCERLFNCYSRCLAGPAAAAVVAACGGYWSQFSTGAPITATLFPGDGIDPEIAESIKQSLQALHKPENLSQWHGVRFRWTLHLCSLLFCYYAAVVLLLCCCCCSVTMLLLLC